jgi:alpha-glucosidase
MARAGYEALRREQPARRPWLLSRSGWAGLQRYSWNWTGDISGSWATLRQTVQMVLGLSLSGVPYTGPDIGGFSGHPSAELFVRWFQLGALLPFFRTHSSIETPRREPWTFGREMLDLLRETLRLRYRLLPYYYTLAWQTHQTGLPLLRPLFWSDPTDPALWDCDDAFLLGDALLVAPVLDEGASERTIACFPPGAWYSFWDDQQQRGSTSATVAAPLGRLPLFVRGGHLLPTDEEGRLTLHLYGPLGRGEVYTDAGDGYGDWRVDQYRWEEQDGALTLSHEHTGDYPPPADGIDIVAHGFTAERARLNDQPLEQIAPGRWRLPRPGA